MTELDLTPAVSSDLPKRRARNWLLMLGIGLLLVFVLWQALSSARVFYYNVDEAVDIRTELGEDTFRMQGVVVTEPATNSSGAMAFVVVFNEVRAEVVHVGEEPSDLFDLGQPVVVEGHWQGETFVSTQILVKHSESYVADNGDRPGVGETPVSKQ